MEVGGDKGKEVLSLEEHPDRRHSSSTSGASELVSDCQRTPSDEEKQRLDMEEMQLEKQAAGDAAKEQMASPTHPVHLFEKEEPDLDTNPSSPSSSSKNRVLSAAAYANFVHVDASEEEESVNPSLAGILLLSSAGNQNKFSLNLSSHAGAPGPLLRRGFDLKGFKTSELLMAIKSSVEEAVRARSPTTDFEHGPSVMSPLPTRNAEDDDEEEAPEQGQVRENKSLDQLRHDISDHPLYPETVVVHIDILKIGAPRELRIKLDRAFKTFQRASKGGRPTSKLGQDPELDYFMKSYVAMLTSFRVQLEEPFNAFMQFMDKTTKELEDLCGHYVETKPEEEDNYGFEISPRERARDEDNDEYSEKNTVPGEEDQTSSVAAAYAFDIDESIVVDPDASEEELKKVLRMKYGRHLGALKPEFNRVRKKGKLPEAARRILKEWFNLHSHWPYPSEMEKAYLQQLCELSQKQINNWFINERKRHWNSEERSMYPNPKSTDDDAAGEGSGHLENW